MAVWRSLSTVSKGGRWAMFYNDIIHQNMGGLKVVWFAKTNMVVDQQDS